MIRFHALTGKEEGVYSLSALCGYICAAAAAAKLLQSDSATPQKAAHQAPPSLGFSRQEHWSGLPFPPPMHGSEK